MCQAVAQAVQDHELIQYRLKNDLPKPPSEVHLSVTPKPSLSTISHDGLTTDDDNEKNREVRMVIAVTARDLENELISAQKILKRPFLYRRSKEKKTHSSKQHRWTSIRMRSVFCPGKSVSSSVHFEMDNASCSSSLFNPLTATENRQSSTQQDLPSGLDEFKHTLIKATEQEILKSLLNTNDIYQVTTLKFGAIDRLQHTLVQTIEKRVTTQHNDSDVLKKLFVQMKQVAMDTVIQQQSVILQDVIKQTVFDARIQQSNPLSGALSPLAAITTTRGGTFTLI